MNYQLIAPINPDYTPTQQILTNRGININDIDHYIKVTEEDNLPFSFLNNIESAVQIVIKHLFNSDSHIALIVDSDYDGYSSAALFLNYVNARWPSTIQKITYILHDSKIHGIETEKLPADTTLVLVPDASSNEYEIHQELSDKGIDVVVLDHHHADQVSQFACVVNNQLCDYPTKSLCGCGIVYKFCQCIDQLLDDPGFVDQFLDIVGTGLN